MSYELGDYEQNYRALGNAIIIQTVKDYQKAYNKVDVLNRKLNLAKYNKYYGAKFLKDYLNDDTISKEEHAMCDHKIREILKEYDAKYEAVCRQIISNWKMIANCERFFYTKEFGIYSNGIDGPRALKILKERLANGTLELIKDYN